MLSAFLVPVVAVAAPTFLPSEKKTRKKWSNPPIPESDHNQISPYNITPESHSRVTRIKEMITN